MPVAGDLFPQNASIAAKVAQAWVDVGVLKEASPAAVLANVSTANVSTAYVSAAYVIAPRLKVFAGAAAFPAAKKIPAKKAGAKFSRGAPKK